MNRDYIQPYASASIHLDQRRMLKSGRYPTKLYLYYQGEPKCIGMTPRVELTPEEWAKVNSPRLQDPELKIVRDELKKREVRASKIIKMLGENFSFKTFKALYSAKEKIETGSSKNVYKAFKRNIDILMAEDREGTANTFIDAMTSFRRFRKKLTFEEVTPEFLLSYEKHMLSKGRSTTTIGIYMRNLRRIVNIARKAKITTNYAFADYEIPTGQNIKKSLDENLLVKFINYKSDNPLVAWAHDMWCFSFFCNGMNITDICHLKGENISEDRIVFTRKKTERTKRKNIEPVVVYITRPIREILDRYGKFESNEFVFGLLNDKMSNSEKYHAIKNAIRRINYHSKKITHELNMKKATTYVARHSWATTVMRQGASMIYISKGLGHSSTQTTEKYLAGFTSKQQIDMSKKLLRLCKF